MVKTLGGDQNAISGLIKKVVGSRNISMCSPEKVKLITGYEIGSIPPFHWQPKGFRSFIDKSLLQETVLGVGSGLWRLETFITPEKFDPCQPCPSSQPHQCGKLKESRVM
ncbi:MAG: YbaK/EbsC family protein [Parachlamydiaceae bacterium]|nr:YbaK/EbsC family protein [Parachlamydiaceae bacterium]